MNVDQVPLALSCGDPAGIGPEIALRAALHWAEAYPSLLFGDPEQLQGIARRLGKAPLPVLATAQEWHSANQRVAVIGACQVSADAISQHAPNDPCGEAQLQCLRSAIDAVGQGQANALVTAPMSKAAVQMSGTAFRGHTEYLAAAAGLPSDGVSMLFLGPRVRVGLVTTHLALSEVPKAVTAVRVQRTLIHIVEALVRLAANGQIHLPASIAVAGLNPHAGEDGMFGREEQTIIAPVIAKTRQQPFFQKHGLDIVGPLGAETAFRLAAQGKYAAVVAMYHDQATIASKLVDWSQAVNVTWGLPFIRTSVDHGVAYDAARAGQADAAGMIAAMRAAIDLLP